MTDTPNEDLDSLDLAQFIARIIDEKQGTDTIILPVGDILSITDWHPRPLRTRPIAL